MNWYWKARIYNSKGDYSTTFIKTGQSLREIDAIQDFYFGLTGCKLLLEGMSEQPPQFASKASEIEGLHGFHILWEPK